MRRYTDLKLCPKLKVFVNGWYIYNPTIDESSLKHYRDMISSYVKYLCNAKLQDLSVVVSHRAKVSRYLLRDRRRLIQHKSRMK